MDSSPVTIIITLTVSLLLLATTERVSSFTPHRHPLFGHRHLTTTSLAVTATTPTSNATSSAAPLFVDATKSSKTHADVSNYYGKELQTSEDLKTNACCAAGAPPQYIQECLAKIADSTKAKYYGCGLCLPQYDMTGCSVLDLGCGAGRDVYIASQLVGPTGRVVGIDMTDEQLEAARSTQEYHATNFGYSNVEFHQGYLEQLDAIAALEPNSFDVIISNCVLNLCQDKEAVLRHCARLLKDGGEMYFSDVYASRRVPQTLQDNTVLWGECLSGALYWNDFENLARAVGFVDPRLVEDAPITIQSPEVQLVMDEAGQQALEFYSATYRLWKLADGMLEPHCEDFGLAVRYKGTIPRYPSGWTLDKKHYFETGRLVPVCGNTYRMLEQPSMLAEHFEFIGDFSTHFGIFEGCGGATAIPYDRASSATTSEGADKSKEGSLKGSCC